MLFTSPTLVRRELLCVAYGHMQHTLFLPRIFFRQSYLVIFISALESSRERYKLYTTCQKFTASRQIASRHLLRLIETVEK